MPFKRPAINPHASSSGQTSRSESPAQDETPPLKRSKSSKNAKALPTTKVYIVQAKMDTPTIAELFVLAEKNCEKLCKEVEEADVVITAIGMRKRFERHVPWNIAVSALTIIAKKEGDGMREVFIGFSASAQVSSRKPRQS